MSRWRQNLGTPYNMQQLHSKKVQCKLQEFTSNLQRKYLTGNEKNKQAANTHQRGT